MNGETLDRPSAGAADRPPLTRWVWAVAALSLAAHFLPTPGYGFHRDELLYLAMGEHLRPLTMEFPPLIAALAELARALPLPLLAAIRLLAALAAAGTGVLTALLVRETGGGRIAQGSAAAAVLCSPLFVRAGTLFQPVVFEQLWWTLAFLALAALLAGRDRRWWLVLGVALGLGALTKFSVAFLGVGVLVAVLASPLRQDLRARWPWLAALVMTLLAVPTVLGQVVHGWPFLAQARELKADQLQHFSRVEFVTGQFPLLGTAAPLWLIGFGALLFAPAFRRFRSLGWAALIIFATLLVAGGKAYYFGPALPLLVAAAAMLLVLWLDRPGRRWALALVIAACVLGNLPLYPFGAPVLPPAAMVRYELRFGQGADRTNSGGQLPLPQDYADMTGWREQVEAVAGVYRSLPPEERARAAILATNYGRTGALALFGREYGLPYPISRNGDFWFWGTGGKSGEIVIVVGASRESLGTFFGEVTEAARVRDPWGVEEERDVTVWICRHPRTDLESGFRMLGPEWG
ncbi:MAG TPA: glycosyltransferase family 39 protein [Gemmatimonadales bacterium]|nr:glycosyltransferase family 39 protein [Gemmatimonadales bacterium]